MSRIEAVLSPLRSRKNFYDVKDDDGSKCQMCQESKLLKELQSSGTERPPDSMNSTAPPPWFDIDKLKRGQAVFHRYFLNIIVSNLVGLLCLLSYESILNALVFTNRSSTSRTANKRYLSTINHIRVWYSANVFDPHTMAFKSIQLVRRMHLRSHRDARNATAAFASQADMVVTQWAFFGLVLTHGKRLGITCTHEEEEGLVHFWKCIGYLMGIEDRYNLACGDLEEVRQNCHAVVHHIIIPALASPPAKSSDMSEAMMEGVHMIVPLVDPLAFSGFTRNLLGMKKDEMESQSYSRFIFNFMVWNFEIAQHLPVIGTFLRNLENGLLIFALYVCNLLPIVSSSYSKWKQYVISLWQGLIMMIMEIITFKSRNVLNRKEAS